MFICSSEQWEGTSLRSLSLLWGHPDVSDFRPYRASKAPGSSYKLRQGRVQEGAWSSFLPPPSSPIITSSPRSLVSSRGRLIGDICEKSPPQTISWTTPALPNFSQLSWVLGIRAGLSVHITMPLLKLVAFLTWFYCWPTPDAYGSFMLIMGIYLACMFLLPSLLPT